VLRFCSQIRPMSWIRVARRYRILRLAEYEDDVGRGAKGFDLASNDYLLKADRPAGAAGARAHADPAAALPEAGCVINYEQSIALASTRSADRVGITRRYLAPILDQLLAAGRGANNKPALRSRFGDIDHFKKLNDSYGHAIRRQVLIEFTRRLIRNLRSLDLVARIGRRGVRGGGCPTHRLERARRISERLREKVEAEPFQLAGLDPIRSRSASG